MDTKESFCHALLTSFLFKRDFWLMKTSCHEIQSSDAQRQLDIYWFFSFFTQTAGQLINEDGSSDCFDDAHAYSVGES